MLLGRVVLAMYYEMSVKHFTKKIRYVITKFWYKMLLRNSCAKCYYEMSGQHFATKHIGRMLLRISGEKCSPKTRCPPLDPAVKPKAVILILSFLTAPDLLVYKSYLKYFQDRCKDTKRQTLCAVPWIAVGWIRLNCAFFPAMNEHVGQWSIQNHEQYIIKLYTFHRSHRTPFDFCSRHQSWRNNTPWLADSILSGFTHVLPCM
jgi:hypothetical protein